MESVRAAEVIAALSLATDLGTGLPLEHGLRSTLVAARVCDRLGVDTETAIQTYYSCLLFYVGCTADAEVVADLFPGGAALKTHFTPVMFGSRPELVVGLFRALSMGEGSAGRRRVYALRTLPRALKEQRRHLVSLCEVARMLTRRLGLPDTVQELFAAFAERWDGRGAPRGLAGEDVPLPVRIVQLARDATFHRLVGGWEFAVRTLGERAGQAFDPTLVQCLVDGAPSVLSTDGDEAAWERVLASEPGDPIRLSGTGIENALDAIGDFADLISPCLAGHSSSVADLAARAAEAAGLTAREAGCLRRAAAVHDLGRVSAPGSVWRKTGRLSTDEWERIRLHPYYTQRVLSRSSFLAPVAKLAGAHHERMDGSGYPAALSGSSLPVSTRILAAAEAFRSMLEIRPHRAALRPDEATRELARDASEGRLDPIAVAAVLEVAGQPAPPMQRPGGLSDREIEVICLIARGLQTKHVAKILGISSKTADRHIQNAYRKIGVSTRAAAALFAMEHGLVGWGGFPIERLKGGV